MKSELDSYDQKILALLQANARLGYTEIGRQIHLSSPAVAERIRRLEDAGVIAGYGVRLNLRTLGYSFEAFIQVTVESHAALDAWAAAHPEVLALHATTGSHCALLRVAVVSPEHLQTLLFSLGEIGKTSTSVVLTSQLEDRPRLTAEQLLAMHVSPDPSGG
ncbi:Lrp/AsnC family transcriptional regulator [Parachitinimonas caeni]|uniref:Lrp/AsnC family transcriptional regulator n=1 Tax=Parachitinimonas caeni TaxID=3031301 RepID=A0ABT7E1Y3_9NEIS|nr:Lrp/AsnC family transcriptional regulator [Parachitinimonas caeni]MDK2125348.1 Lrp/AsnC family transcriptional regulator [Parachitinimonas caeni]